MHRWLTHPARRRSPPRSAWSRSPTTQAVTTTYLADDGLIAGLQSGAVVCDTSTVAPATVRGLTPLVAQQGATLIDTPVSGSVSVVESGTLTVMVGGDQEALDRARPVLEAFAKSIFHLGDVGAGATMKLVVNSLVHSLNVAVSEALVLAEKAGLDRETVYDIFEAGAAGAPYVKYKRAAFLQPGEGPVAFSLALVAKDQELIHDLAEQAGTRMDQAEASRHLVAEAVRPAWVSATSARSRSSCAAPESYTMPKY